MRRILPGLVLLLSGCAQLGNPFDGFGGFIGDTHTIHRNVNSPPGDSVNMLRARGEEPTAAPLLPEQGNVWPGPPPPEPTLSDLEKEQGITNPGEEFPRLPPARGSGSPPAPGPVQPQPGAPMSSFTPAPSPGPPSIQATPPVSVPTDRGQATITTDTNGIQSFRLPDGSGGHVVNNGNGTMTLIGNDGRVFSAPAPR